MFAAPGSSLWRGLAGIPEATRTDLLLLGVKGMLQVGVLIAAPAAVASLLGRALPRAAWWVVAALAVAGLGVSAVMAAGLAPRAWSTLAALSAAPGYAAWAASFGLLLAGRAAVRPGLGRSLLRASLTALMVFVPLLLANDVTAFLGRGDFPLPTDAMAFLVLSCGVLVGTLLVLLGRRRTPGPVDLDAFSAERGLSLREREVLLLLAEGLPYKQIAARLGISADTVKTHASSVYRKSGASGRTDLLYRIRLGGL